MAAVVAISPAAATSSCCHPCSATQDVDPGCYASDTEQFSELGFGLKITSLAVSAMRSMASSDQNPVLCIFQKTKS